MELSYLFEFITLAEEKNYHNAAARLGISQPTLTSHIKKLEQELETSLFDRGTRHVELSEYGRALYPYAESMISLYEDAVHAVRVKQNREKVVLTVAIEPHYMVGDLLRLFELFRRSHPNVLIEFINIPETTIHQVLRTGRCDMAIVPQMSAKDKEFTAVTIREERAVAFVSRDHPFAGRDSVPIRELREENLLIPPARLVLYQMLSAACRSAGFELDPSCMGASETMGILLAKQGQGVLILTDYAAKKLGDEALSMVSLRPELKWYLNLLCANVHLSPEGRDLLSFIRSSLTRASAPEGSN